MEQNKREQFIIRRIGGTTYKVRVVFNESGGETMEDKILRIVRNDERLSRDDDNAGDSNSIVNQKKYLESYAQQRGYTNCRHYTDDGWSGGNFERPAWKQLIADIEAGKVAHVIVKDYCAIIGLNQKDLENQGILA